ncbi:hypothetical protein [Streptomyces sp. NPDC048106]|uniref:hypothetical protein n=1 Tax=Streptomyces sp. NPDC048106 TaxID=3155750 RepID=UPI0034511DE7
MAPAPARSALVDQRAGLGGLPGASVAWGPWADAGTAPQNDGLLEQPRRAGLPEVDWERFPLPFTYSRPCNRLLADLAE